MNLTFIIDVPAHTLHTFQHYSRKAMKERILRWEKESEALYHERNIKMWEKELEDGVSPFRAMIVNNFLRCAAKEVVELRVKARAHKMRGRCFARAARQIFWQPDGYEAVRQDFTNRQYNVIDAIFRDKP